MRSWLSRAPLRTVFLFSAGFVFAVMVAIQAVLGRRIDAAVVGALVGAPLWSAMMTWGVIRPARARFQSVLGRPVSAEELKALDSAVRTGRVPDDPELRAAAHQLAVGQRPRRGMTIAAAVLAVAIGADSVRRALGGAPGWWVAAALVLVAGPAAITLNVRRQRRIVRALAPPD